MGLASHEMITHQWKNQPTPLIIMDRSRLCSCSSSTEAIWSFAGLNRNPRWRSDLVYGERADMMRLQSFQSDVMSVFGPTRARRPQQTTIKHT
jgi:hypothetical protein